jgi:hypothetical protein
MLRAYGTVVEQGIWIIGYNKEIRELYKLIDTADIKKKRLEYIGHVVILDKGRRV